MSNFKVSQLPASTALVVEDILPVVDVSEMLTKKAEVGDLIDLAANTIESMPNLIVDPENNFTNFSQAVRNELTGGDGITYTAATGEVKLTNKSITINGNTVNLGGSTTIPVGTTYSNGTGINIVGTTINALQFSVNGVAGNLGTNITIPVGTTTTLSSGGTLSSNLTFSPSSGNVTATLNVNPIFRSIVVAKDNPGDSDQQITSHIGLFSAGAGIPQTALKVESSQTGSIAKAAAEITNNGAGVALNVVQNSAATGLNISKGSGAGVALVITNNGVGNCFEVNDFTSPGFGDPDPSKFIIDAVGNVGIGVSSNVADEKLRVEGKLVQNGSYSNKANIVTATNISINGTTNNFIFTGNIVTGTLPSLANDDILGTEFAFRKISSGILKIQTNSPSERIDLAPVGFSLVFNTPDEVFLKLRAIEVSPGGGSTDRLWAIVYLNIVKSTVYDSIFQGSGSFSYLAIA